MNSKIENEVLPRPASKTALYAAACRRYGTECAEQLCNDPWAASLAGEEGEAIRQEIVKEYSGALPTPDIIVALRAGYIDAYVAHSTRVRNEFSQVVTLGAGLDTRAARLAHSGVKYYEVDHPESQAYKLQSLRKLVDYPQEKATYIASDFKDNNYLEMLCAAGFRADEPALFILEGVVHYLAEPLIRSVLEPIAKRCHPKSTVIFDYMTCHMESYSTGNQIATKYEEPLYWTNENPLRFLKEIGFRHVRTIPFDQIFTSATGQDCDRKDFVQTVSLARATRQTFESPYLW